MGLPYLRPPWHPWPRTAHPRPSLSHSATKLTPLLWSYASIPSLKPTYTGWWYTYPSEKYESQLGLLFPIYGKIKSCSKPPNSIVSEGCWKSLKENMLTGNQNCLLQMFPSSLGIDSSDENMCFGITIQKTSRKACLWRMNWREFPSIDSWDNRWRRLSRKKSAPVALFETPVEISKCQLAIFFETIYHLVICDTAIDYFRWPINRSFEIVCLLNTMMFYSDL